jgi:predicted CopG family antitoxin
MEPREENVFRTITIRESTYNQLALIAKKQDLLNEKGKASMRDVIAYLVKNYGDKIA